MMDIVERLREIDEEAMYQAPATTYAIIQEAAALIEEAQAALAGLLATPRNPLTYPAEVYKACALYAKLTPSGKGE
jgi:hypothetical protein